MADAKNIYVVGAKILLTQNNIFQNIMYLMKPKITQELYKNKKNL